MNPVRCRPPRDFWALVGIFAFVGGIFLAMPLLALSRPGVSRFDLWGVALMASLAGFLPASLFSIWVLRATVVADEVGLRWRGMRGHWKSARWHEVTDYYEQRLPKQQYRNVIETSAGSVSLNHDWTNFAALRDVVEQKAVRARAQGWSVIGTRPEDDWPQVFHYETKENRRLPVRIATCLALLVAVMLWQHGTKILQVAMAAPDAPGRAWDLAGIGIVLLAMLAYLSMLLSLWLPILRATRSHRGERITASLEGLVFEDGERRVTARWDEVTDYFRGEMGEWIKVHGSFIVVTRQGRFEFVSTIREWARLMQIIERYATAVARPGWPRRESDTIGSAAEQWSGGSEGVGQRIYHYRTYTNRALLWMPTGLTLVFCLVAGLTYLGLTPGRDVAVGLWPAALCGAVALWGWWRFYAASVRTDEQGIVQYGLFGRKHIRWDDVQDYYLIVADVLSGAAVVSSTTRIWFSMLIADVSELQAEITRRAVHSRSKEWAPRVQAAKETENAL